MQITFIAVEGNTKKIGCFTEKVRNEKDKKSGKRNIACNPPSFVHVWLALAGLIFTSWTEIVYDITVRTYRASPI